MIINQPISREAWRKLLESLRAAKAASYVPEYSDEGERSLNHRYYR